MNVLEHELLPILHWGFLHFLDDVDVLCQLELEFINEADRGLLLVLISLCFLILLLEHVVDLAVERELDVGLYFEKRGGDVDLLVEAGEREQTAYGNAIAAEDLPLLLHVVDNVHDGPVMHILTNLEYFLHCIIDGSYAYFITPHDMLLLSLITPLHIIIDTIMIIGDLFEKSWKMIISPPKIPHRVSILGPREQIIDGKLVKRVDFSIPNQNGINLSGILFHSP